MNASELYALSQSNKCEGERQCYWCGSPCNELLKHSEPSPTIDNKIQKHLVKIPSSQYICMGCWLWNRQRITITFLETRTDGITTFRDRQCPVNFSSLILTNQMYGLDFPACSKDLYEFLLHPEPIFSLAFIDNGYPNYIQQAIVNEQKEIKADTQLNFTVNGKPLSYSIYELEHALRHGTNGKEPGVQELVKRLGKHEVKGKDPQVVEEKDKPGRNPPLADGKILKEVRVKN